MNEFEKFVNDNRDAFDVRTPDPAVLQRIQHAMGAGKEKEPVRSVVVPMKTVRWAAACILFVAGATIFLLLNRSGSPVNSLPVTAAVQQPVMQPKENAATVPVDEPAGAQTEVAAADVPASPRLRQPSEGIQKQALFARLNDMQSASERLDAATRLNALPSISTDIIDALVNTMNHDPSTNVRLAALDALSKFRKEKYVRKQLIASLGKQKDPMVQISLIDLLTKMREKAILAELDKLVNDNTTIDAVKENAYSGIFTLRM